MLGIHLLLMVLLLSQGVKDLFIGHGWLVKVMLDGLLHWGDNLL